MSTGQRWQQDACRVQSVQSADSCRHAGGEQGVLSRLQPACVNGQRWYRFSRAKTNQFQHDNDKTEESNRGGCWLLSKRRGFTKRVNGLILRDPWGWKIPLLLVKYGRLPADTTKVMIQGYKFEVLRGLLLWCVDIWKGCTHLQYGKQVMGTQTSSLSGFCGGASSRIQICSGCHHEALMWLVRCDDR